MKRKSINVILTLFALVPMTFYLLLTVYGIVNVLMRFAPDDALLLLSMVFGVLGYVGLAMNLKQNKELKVELINFILLLIGVSGGILFTSIEGGLKAWKWIFTIEEPDEWLMSVGPVLIVIFLMVLKGKRLKTLYMKS